MIRATSPEHDSGSPKRHTKGLRMSISALFALFTKQTSRLSVTPKTKPKPNNSRIEPRSPRSPLSKPKQLLTNISSKTIPFVHHKKKNDEQTDTEDWGDGGVWQRTILMGDKCQPLDYSGVIYYDNYGKQLNEIPMRSPRASPLPGYLTRRLEQEL
ncbi:Transmembrane protein [Quillaja saponaria]|uniref:Transmembrane protein n=1 Tax=Quillaja saponaria TaxID=32244 RepID=A0AAD7LGD1_QUISA|nr:Transmembrane protein [Quillaja saponaria]